MQDAISHAVYKDAMIVLATAAIIVPTVHRLKIGTVLGFLAAGAIFGPKGLGALSAVFPPLGWITVSQPDGIAAIAELGVVFLMFLIGLELSLRRLITMRRLVFGLGSGQLFLSAAAIGGVAFAYMPAAAALIVGFSLAMSSTAIVIELLSKQQRMNSAVGRATFSVLLFQDLFVVPLLFMVGILGSQQNGSLVIGVLTAVLQAAVAMTIIIAAGRFLAQPLFKHVAATQSSELFVAATLFVSVGTSLIAASAGMSMALGAFVAGLLLAETEFRRAIEATIEPFKGLLLGVFFFSIGMGLDIKQLLSDPGALLAAVLALIAVKTIVMLGLSRALGQTWPNAIESAVLVAPSGEFAAIVIGIAVASGTVGDAAGAFTLAVVSLSMASIPLCDVLARTVSKRLTGEQLPSASLIPPPEDQQSHAIVIGHGRVGQLICEMLERHGIPHIATDRDTVIVSKWRKEGRSVYYGDGRQPLFLDRCGIASANALIITIHTQNEIDEIVRLARAKRPDLVIVSRARDAQHARHLYEMGVTDAVPETIEASLQLSEVALVGLGVPMGPVIATIHERRDEFRRELKGYDRTLRTHVRSQREASADAASEAHEIVKSF